MLDVFTCRYLAILAITKPSASMHLYELSSLFRQPLLLRLPALTIMQRKKQRPSSFFSSYESLHALRSVIKHNPPKYMIHPLLFIYMLVPNLVKLKYYTTGPLCPTNLIPNPAISNTVMSDFRYFAITEAYKTLQIKLDTIHLELCF
jgi:hypothetical protein